MIVTELHLPGLFLIQPDVHRDARGFFLETFRTDRYREAGLDVRLVQFNQSRSVKGVLRGLHFQRRHPQGKLVRVARGAVYDVVVDLRRDSPAFGQHVGMVLDDGAHHQLWIPPGLAHGFCVLSESADFVYGCSEIYRPDDEGGIRWSDPALAIEWPITEPIVSARDAVLPLLAELAADELPARGAAASSALEL